MLRRTAVAIAAAALVLPLAGTASAAQTLPANKALTCRTEVIDNGITGIAHCENHTNRAIAFRAVVVCGGGPDGKGHWVTLNPGYRGWSGYTCNGVFHTGVGSVDWEEG